MHLHNFRGDGSGALSQVRAKIEGVIRVIQLDLAALGALEAVHETRTHLSGAREGMSSKGER